MEDSNDTLAIDLLNLGPASSVEETNNVDPQPLKPKAKERGFKIFEDPAPGKQTSAEDHVLVETSMKTLALNDENDENALPSDRPAAPKQAKKTKKDSGNRTRKIKLVEKRIKNETKTIQINLNSPTGPKTLKRLKSSSAAVERSEPTMTINTKEAMDEIYGIFSQPMQSEADQPDQEEDEDESESSSEDELDDDDCTTDGDSTATGKLSAPASEYGDETRNEILKIRNRRSSDQAEDSDGEDRTDNTGWSDFTMSKPAQQNDGHDESHVEDDDEPLATPVDDEDPHTLYMSEEYPPQLPNHRLPFMTPIVEQTESSLGAGTIRADRHAYAMKTPSRKVDNGIASLLDGDEDDQICSSPFDEVTLDRDDTDDDDDDDDDENMPVLQPIRTKSTKGTLSLGQGSAKAQTSARSFANTNVEDANAVQKGPIINENQCNPMDPELRATIIAQMRPALCTFEGYHEDLSTTSGRTAEIKKFVRAQSKAGKASSASSTGVPTDNKTASSISVPPVINLPGAYSQYTIKRELGAGTFAPVYLAENSTAAALDVQEEATKGGNQNDQVSMSRARLGKAAHRRALEAVKMEAPPSVWEFYMLRQSHRRLGSDRATQSIVRAHEMHLFQDECFLIEEYRSQGTLLDLVNLAREDAPSGGMDEILAMWCTVELLRTVEALHARGLIHGDLKADNILVRLDDPGVEMDWSPTYWANGAHGWDSKGVCLIDFGRGIDMRHFKPDVGFLADWKTTDADCNEMRELRPWTYQIDYYGLAGIIHSLLFGKYMETINDKQPGAATGLGAASAKSYRIRETLKRYWQTDIWASAFDLLLNPLSHLEQEEGRRMPVLSGMRECRERMESWLEENCERGNGLRNTILRMEALIRERKRKAKA
jgi:checkpoint serine/threonine-protein kinase